MMGCLIASTSARLDLPLFTANLKHFEPLLGRSRRDPTEAWDLLSFSGGRAQQPRQGANVRLWRREWVVLEVPCVSVRGASSCALRSSG